MKIGIIGSMQYTEKMLELREQLAYLGHTGFVTDLHEAFVGKTDEEKEVIKIHQKNIPSFTLSAGRLILKKHFSRSAAPT